MPKKNDGGPAFSGKSYIQRYRSGNTPAEDAVWNKGMSLRDYFASKAMEAQLSALMIMSRETIAAAALLNKKDSVEEFFNDMLKSIPKNSYNLSDMMILESGND